MKKTEADEQEINCAHGWVDGVHAPSWSIYLGDLHGQTEVEHGIVESGNLVDRFVQGIHALEHGGAQHITVKVNCGGGEVRQGLAIYDAIRSCACPVVAVVYGQCASMAVAILQAADYRVMMPHATLMLHFGMESASGSQPNELDTEVKEMRRLDQIYNRIIADRTGLSTKQTAELCAKTVYIDAKEAVKMKLADKVHRFRKRYKE